MLIGYARTSTVDQRAGLEAQEAALEAARCDKIFIEQVSSVNTIERHALATAIDHLRTGDTLVVTKLDRLARSIAHLQEILNTLKEHGGALRVLDMGIDTGTPTGKLLLNLMGGIAEFEREIMLERQREGIAKAKAQGKYKGRKPTAMNKAGEIRQMAAQGIRKTDIATQLGVSRASVYRALAQVS